MKVSITGTFNVLRKELEKKITEAGHAIVGLSEKTEILLAGEKTASPKKIGKAETAGVRIIREVDAEKIILLLREVSISQVSSYRSYYDRYDGDKVVLVEASINDVGAVLDDYISASADAGEWFAEQDGKYDLKSITGGKGDSILEFVGVIVKESAKVEFLTALYRLILLRVVTAEALCECEHKEIPALQLLAADFYKNLFNYLSFESADDKAEVKKDGDIKKIIAEAAEEEQWIGKERPLPKPTVSDEQRLEKIFKLFEKEIRKITDLIKVAQLSPAWLKNIDLNRVPYNHAKLMIRRDWDYTVQINGVENFRTSIKEENLLNNLEIVEDFLKSEIKIFDCPDSFSNSIMIVDIWKKINPPKKITPPSHSRSGGTLE